MSVDIVSESNSHINMAPGYKDLRDRNINPAFDIHLHTKSGEGKTTEFSSDKDQTETDAYKMSGLNTEANWVLGWNTGTTNIEQKDALGNILPTYTIINNIKKLTFYDENGDIATFNFEDFQITTEKVNKDLEKRYAKENKPE